MRTIDKNKPVLVTGGNGYLASWIIKQLLEDGYHVYATVRDKTKIGRYVHLSEIERKTKGKIKIFEADLLTPNSYDHAMKGCELVIHTAFTSKRAFNGNTDKEFIQPAMRGINNILNSVNKTESVKRVVLTSSLATMYGDAIDIQKLDGGKLTEDCWNTTSTQKHQPFSYVKKMVEEKAWEMANEQSRWDLIVINPGLLFGPSLSKHTDSTYIELMTKLFSGKLKGGIPAGKHAIIDVRNAARAHVLAGYTETASGRHIAAAHQKDLLDIASVISRKHKKYKLPTKHVSKWWLKITGPSKGYSRKYIDRNVGHDVVFDNSYIKKDLGIDFYPFEKTVTDHFMQLVNNSLIPDKR